MLYDDVLKLIGEFGRYQKWVVILTALCSLTSGPAQFSSVFTLAIPKYRCAIPGYDNDTYQIQNDYHQYVINQSIPPDSNCMLRNQSSDHYGNMTSQDYKCQSWVYETTYFTSTFVTKISAVAFVLRDRTSFPRWIESKFDLVCDNAVYRSNAVMMLFLGLLVGYSTLSTVADIFGRKPLIVICTFIFVASHYLMIWTPNYIFLLCVRFIIGFSMAGQVLALYIIGLEFVGPNHRLYAGVASFFTWVIGCIIYVILAYFIRDWRNLTIALAVYSTPVIFYFLVLPESPRWLLTRGYHGRANVIIIKTARINRVTLDDELPKYTQVEDKVTKVKYWRLFTNCRLCIRTLIIYFLWFASSMIYYGLILNLDVLAGDVFINFMVTIVLELLAYTEVLVTTDRIGRKMMLCIGLVVAALSLTICIFTVLYVPIELNWITTVLALLGKVCATVAFCVLWFWTGELYPTELRNTGIGTGSAMARLASVVAPYIGYMRSSIGGDVGKISPFIVYSIICIVALTLSAITLPETSHLTLPETIDDCIQLDTRCRRNRSSNINHDEREDKRML